LLERYPELKDKEHSLDLLLKLDSGQAIGLDGEAGGGAVDYFEQVCQGIGKDGNVVVRNPVSVLTWWALFLPFMFTRATKPQYCLCEQVNARSSRSARRKKPAIQPKSDITRAIWSDPRPHIGKAHHR
jgi:hypothetical protein